MPIKPKLNSDEILKAEYNYIANTVFQANEDRSRVTTFYFVSVGSLIAAILGFQFGENQTKGVSLAFFFLFLVLTAMGWLTIAQLARLRAAWHESVEAMNKIKDYYIKDNPEIASAFKWRVKSIPPTNKPHSIANFTAFEVAMLGSLTTSAGIYFLMSFLGNLSWVTWVFVAASFIFGFLAQWSWYLHLLVDDR